MHKNLYECFKHWYHGGQIYFISDPHFNDEETKRLRKNYIEDEEQIRRINSVVRKNDTLIILGDVGDKEWVKKLKGYKVLVLGNHDKGASTYKGYFDEVYEGVLTISDKIILSHEPVDFKYAFNIHGHTHDNKQFQDNRHLNVCVEWIDYRPISLKEIVKSGKLKGIPNIHRECIDKKK